MSDEIAVPLDPIYCITEHARNKPQKPVENKAPAFNRWRAALPKRCWTCSMFNKCTPTTKCVLNPNTRKG